MRISDWSSDVCSSDLSNGRAVGEQRFLGLFTSSAYNRRPWDIPLVRHRFEHVMRRSGLAFNSHSGKALRHILETLPRDELFQSTEDELFQTCLRSEEHTSELQSLMRISYAVFCLKKKKRLI